MTVESIIFLVVAGAIGALAIRDLLRHPESLVSHGTKVFWIVFIVVSFIFYPPLSVVASLVYLWFMRPRLHAAQGKLSEAEKQKEKIRPFERQSSKMPPFGWYPDPAGSAFLRWWDGLGWTEMLQEKGPEPTPS